jgi:hypothetical protein
MMDLTPEQRKLVRTGWTRATAYVSEKGDCVILDTASGWVRFDNDGSRWELVQPRGKAATEFPTAWFEEG